MTHEEIQALLDRADSEQKKANYDEAERLANEALAKNPTQMPQQEGFEDSSPFPSGEGRDGVLFRAHAFRILGWVAYSHCNYTLSLQYFTDSQAAAEAADDKIGVSKAMNGLGIVNNILGSYDMALEYHEKALSMNEELGEKLGAAYAMENMGSVYLNLGSCDRALEYMETALTAYEEFGEKSGVVRVTGNIGTVYYNLGSCEKALDYFQKALAAHEGLGEKSGVARVTGNIGAVYYFLGFYDKALDYYQKAFAAHEELGEKSDAARVTGNIGVVFRILGSSDKALDYYEKALVAYKGLGAKSGTADVTLNIGVVYYNLGSYNKALEYYEKALVAYEELGMKSFVALVTGNYGSAYASIGFYDKALQYFAKALTAHEDLGDKRGVADVTENIGKLYAEKKFDGYDAAKAEDLLMKALTLATEIGNKGALVVHHKALAELYENEERWKESQFHFRKYHELKEEVQSAEARKAAEMMEMRRVIAEKEREREFQKQQMELEMKLTREELSNKALQLVQQTEMLQNFRGELEHIVRHTQDANKSLKIVEKKIRELPENVMNWERFEDDFRSVHPKFQHILKERFPELTPMEVKVCCLLRIGMKSHEIGTLLFLADRSVENHRFRLRKKLRLTNGQELIDVLGKI